MGASSKNIRPAGRLLAMLGRALGQACVLHGVDEHLTIRESWAGGRHQADPHRLKVLLATSNVAAAARNRQLS